MDEFSSNFSYDGMSKNNENLDEISFVTARENLTLNRTSLFTVDDTFTSVKSNFSFLSEDEEDFSHDLTLSETTKEKSTAQEVLVNNVSNALGERTVNRPEEYQEDPKEKGEERKKKVAEAPKKSKLKTPKRYFRPLNKNLKRHNLMQFDLSKKSHLLRGGIQKKKFLGQSTKIPLPTIFFKPLRQLDQRN